jgi:anti-sigma factor RsiW
MSGAASCREIRHALGVYVLGAIEPGDRAQVDEHLATCADCREELASLAGLPALLRRVPTAEAERLAVRAGRGGGRGRAGPRGGRGGSEPAGLRPGRGAGRARAGGQSHLA